MTSINEIFEKEESVGIYVSATIEELSSNNLFSFLSNQGVDESVKLTPVHDYHTTILYSRKNIPKEKWINIKAVHRCIPKKYNIFPYKDEKNCIVLELIAPTLVSIHKELIKAGGTHDYSSYIPHITIAYDVPNSFDLKQLKVPKFEIFTERIKSEILDLNWSPK